MAYRFIKHTTGKYRVQRDLYRGGVTLHFEDEKTGELFHAVFNAEVEYRRSTKKHKAGDSLPKGQFRVTKLMGFYKFWIGTGLPIPELTKFGRYMGNLKKLRFDFMVTDNKQGEKKVINETIRVCSPVVRTTFVSCSEDVRNADTYLEALAELPECRMDTDLVEADGHYAYEQSDRDYKLTRISDIREHDSCPERVLDNWQESNRNEQVLNGSYEEWLDDYCGRKTA